MLSGLPRQNGSSMPQMQNPAINGGAKNDYTIERKYMLEKIWEILMKRRQQPHEVPPQKMVDIVKRIEATLFKNATSMDEYLNLATLESRLLLIKRGIQTSNHNQQLSQPNSSPAIATMIPTPGLQQTANSSLTPTSSMDNSFPVVNASHTMTSSVVKSEFFMPNGSGSSTGIHAGFLSSSSGSFSGGFQHSSPASSVNSGARRMTSQMIPTPGFNNSNNNVVNIQSLVNSESTNNGGFSAVESSVASQPMQQKPQVGGQNSHVLHNISGHMGGGIRSTLQKKSYGLSNGPLNGGLGMMGNDVFKMSYPEATDVYFSGGNNKRLIQQQFNQNQQPLYHGDGSGIGAADNLENMHVPVTSAGSVTNQNLNSMHMQSMAKASTPLMMSNHSNVHSTQLTTNLNPVDEKMNFQSQRTVRDNFENHQVRQLQQPSHYQFQHQLQHQVQQEQLTRSQFSLTNDNLGQSQMPHNMISYPRNFIEDRSRATQFIDDPLDVSSSMRQTSDQMEQLPHPQGNDVGIQEDVMVHDHRYSRLQEASHVSGSRLPLDQGVQDQYNEKPTGQSEARLNSSSVEESIIVQTGAPKPVEPPSGSNAFSQLRNTERERQYRNQQRWLLFLRHARRCSAPEGKCQEPSCFNVQRLQKHMENCKSPECPLPRCRQTRLLIDHHRNCRDIKCPVCIPVKNYVQRQLKAVVCSDFSPGLPSSAKASCTSYDTANSGKSTPEANPVIAESLEDLQPSVKRMKIEQGLRSVVSKCETSVPLVCSPNNYQIPKKAEVAEVKVEDPGYVGQVMSEDIEMIKDNFGKADTKVPENNHAASENPAGLNVQDATRSEKEMVQAKTEKALEPQQVGSKSGKPKIMGVSLTELFTPEQIRQHLTGLRQWVGQRKAKAEKNQAREHSMSENSCQLCAAENLTFEPPPIYCAPCGARIKKNGGYHTVGAADTRHYVCNKCYNDARGNTIYVDGIAILKAKMAKIKTTVETNEPWVQCDKCEVWQHQICALFNSRRNEGGHAEYTCPNCYIEEVERGERLPLPQSAVLGAKDLPRSILSDHVEQRLFAKLKHERQERARLQGKSYDEVPGAESLVVRVVSSVDKKLEVKPRFLESLQVENYPTEFPYKSKVILLFQNIEGVEVCLFGMYVQEFGSECQQPNHRRVYLSYLDSVKYFRPDVKTVTGEALRTFVYHEILIGYLEYCKMRGFTSCYIWACPPLKGEDYILYCHPEIQKTPKSDKLREWYLSMLRKASREKIVVSLTNLYDQFFISMGECKTKVTAARLPYFDGDYWPGAAEDMIDKLEQEEGGSKQHKSGMMKRTITKRALKASGQINLSGNVTKDMLLMHKLGQTISPMKEDFIMVHLQHSCTHCCILMVSGNRWVCKQCKDFQLCDKCYDAEQKREDRERHPINHKDKHTFYPIEITDVPEDTRDKDEIIESEFFDTRHAFLSLCQGNHYQYDTLRRAKHSSMMVLYHLHNPTCPAFVTACSACRLDIEPGQGWRCETCPEYEVCNACYRKDGGTGHPHKLTMNQSSDAQNIEARQLRVKQLRKVLDLLVHAHQCRSLQCQYPNCRKVKGLFHHGMMCNVRIAGDCALCKRMWHLLQLHARACKESQCTVPRCKDLKELMRRSQQQSESRRRAAFNEMMRLRASELEVASG